MATSPEGGQVIHEHPRKVDSCGLSLLVMLYSALGAGGRAFDSPHPDHFTRFYSPLSLQI